MSAGLRWLSALADLPVADRQALMARRGPAASESRSVATQVAEILARVQQSGDAALREMALRFDRVELTDLEVPKERWEAAFQRSPIAVRTALTRAAKNIAAAHSAQRPVPVQTETEPGVIVGRRPDPLRRVGVYAPGGRAAYPSSVLMGAVPAKVAGVAEVIVCSPPGANGLPSDAVLTAALVSGVDRLFAIGGAGAIGAMAFGTASVPCVDRIVGPGNAYVAEAKVQVLHRVAIDAPAGPSELLAIADEHADSEAVARELLAQAEHDPDACVVALAVGRSQAEAIASRVLALAQKAHRSEICLAALRDRGAVFWVDALEQVWEFAETFAPEHLLLATRSAVADLARVRSAGTVFLGEATSVAHGDYLTGANHVLPTGGLARAYSGLSLLDFYRWTTWQKVTPEAARLLADDVGALADAEGLFAHAAAARAWKEGTRR